MTALRLAPRPATPAAIAPFGTLIEPGEDGTPFGAADAALDLGQGQPRLYIMRLTARPLVAQTITRHRRVTQCLAATDGKPWFICLAPPSDLDDEGATPEPGSIVCFEIPGGTALALHRGTWHAGPYFLGPQKDFFNLELADTNEVDHHTIRLDERFGLTIEMTA
ncbi:ureidoglycolate lyase [Acetobacteraceae bacterium H6797]|nr:ureidoglycolate lyase [Acetobacteraceae bacterium H6797]